MKMYIEAFDIKPECKEAMQSGKSSSDEDSYDIYYSRLPLWIFPTQELAEIQIAELHRMRIHKNEHYCQLEVEKVGEEQFAMICKDHLPKS
jgi:hypothetical protein